MRSSEPHGPMGKASITPAAPERDCLDAGEVGAAFDALSPDDKLKLSAIEALMRRGTGLGKGDLLHEAVCRAMTGTRNCPRDVPFMAFMVETMRSIASHAREKRRPSDAADVDDLAVGHRGKVGAALPGSNSEADLIARQDAEAVQAIHGHFEDDDEARLLLLGWTDELRGAALREATGLDQGALDYAARRIRTKMRKLYPQGWMT